MKNYNVVTSFRERSIRTFATSFFYDLLVYLFNHVIAHVITHVEEMIRTCCVFKQPIPFRIWCCVQKQNLKRVRYDLCFLL